MQLSFYHTFCTCKLDFSLKEKKTYQLLNSSEIKFKQKTEVKWMSLLFINAQSNDLVF